MPRERISVDEAWRILFEEHPIAERTRGEGVFHIGAAELNRHHEARLMAKFDTSAVLPAPLKERGLSILPVGRGRYALGRFNSYFPVPAWSGAPRPLPPARELQTLRPENLYSEAAAVLYAWNSGILDEVCGGRRPALTVNGRMSSGSFRFRVGILPEAPCGGPGPKAAGGRAGGEGRARRGGAAPEGPERGGLPQVEIEVANAQVEIDAGFEAEDAFYVLEAKNVMAGELMTRQLYYPWRLWSERIKKPVVPVFMVFSNDVFSFYVLAFDDPDRYDSVRLERAVSFRLASGIPLAELDALSRLGVSEPPSGVPFPQADSLERVVDLLGVLRCGGLAPDEATLRYGFDRRQTSYYLSACAWLGLAARSGGPGGPWSLTAAGAGAMSLPPEGKRKALAVAVLGRPVFNEAWRLSLDGGGVPEAARVAESLVEGSPGMARSTALRRARTVRSWIAAILGWTSA
ncbi:MAG: hypothetical protein LBR80_00005 [Deltaproteobacteria bacterium]|jgi:hypothetical protein|nr:hypothetical protein [Deltaproteobacteria bacterium]